jgi:hypothetical protein
VGGKNWELVLLLLEGSVEVVVIFFNISFQIPHSILHIFGLFVKLFEIITIFLKHNKQGDCLIPRCEGIAT